jgi:hypothetical protein
MTALPTGSLVTDQGVADLLSLIRSRGHWHVVVRPTTFSEERVGRLDLLGLVDRAKVSIRGWDFPHVDHKSNPRIAADWVEQAIRWEHRLDYWRIYRSGQFLSICGIPYEWRDYSGWWPADPRWAPNRVLGVMEVVARLTEITEFAARLSQTPAGAETVKLQISLRGMNGRVLVTDSPNRSPLSLDYRSSVESVSLERVVQRVELATGARELAVILAEEVFSYFGWRPAHGITMDVQNEVLRG